MLDGEVLVTPAPTPHHQTKVPRGVEVPPALVIEVSSPSSKTIDRKKKPGRYLDFGVPAYWVVDPAEGVIWMWYAETGAENPRAETKTVRWAFPEGAEPLQLDVEELVAPL